MALGCHGGWKGATDGAADAAWNDSGSSSSGFKMATLSPSSSSLTCGSTRRIAVGNSGVSPSGLPIKGGSTSLPVLSQEASMRCIFLEAPPAVILEIFSHLDARELCVVSCVCSLFRVLACDSHGWKGFYCERWGLPAPSRMGEQGLALPGRHWRELYVAKEARSKAMMGRFSMDMLHGHAAAVRAVRLLPSANLICTGGYDQTVRLWNLEEGLPIACSRSLGETIRAIAIDANILAAGGSDSVVRIWHAVADCPHIFDVAGVWNPASGKGAEALLYGHTGPVTCLDLDSVNLYSGSWDMSIKAWSRSTLTCSRNLRHMDWVWALAQRGRRLLSTAGSDVYTWDVETGQQTRVRMGVHSGQAYAVEGTRSGHVVFTGGEDGGVRMFDDRISKKKSSMADLNEDAGLLGVKEAVGSWTPHSSAVYSLAFDDPWLVSASGDGSLAMMDVRQIMKRATGCGKHSLGGANARWRRSGQYLVSREGDTAQRRLAGFHQSAYCVDIGADRVVSAGEEKTVRIWDFSQALEIERRVQALRSSQIGHRVRRKQQAASTVFVDLKANKTDSLSEDADIGRRKGLHKKQGQKDLKGLAVPGTSGKNPVHRGSGRDFVRGGARYVDSVSVPS